MNSIQAIKPYNVTDDQLAALRQAARRSGEEIWVGDMTPALECCDRGWLSVAHLAIASVPEDASVFYLVTITGAAVLRREQDRREHDRRSKH